jgi:hypothetical protein
MEKQELRFPLMVHVYVWTFLVGIGVSPVLVLLLRRHTHPITPDAWISAIAMIIAIQLLFFYAQRRCSSQALSFWNGLMYVAAFMETGWPYLSIVFVYPSLLAVFILSIALSLYSDMTLAPSRASIQYRRMVGFFYKYRMHQQ